MRPQEFIQALLPGAQVLQRETGLFTSLTIAQAALETGWGKYVPVDKDTGHNSNNLFGIKGTGPAGSVMCWTTEERPDGSIVRVLAKFRAYNNFEECLRDRYKVLMQPRYDRVRQAKTPEEAAGMLYICGWATDSGYPQKLVSIISQYSLKQYDLPPAPFPDVPPGHWCLPALARLKEYIVVVGDRETGKVRGDDPPTRYEMFAFGDALLKHIKSLL